MRTRACVGGLHIPHVWPGTRALVLLRVLLPAPEMLLPTAASARQLGSWAADCNLPKSFSSPKTPRPKSPEAHGCFVLFLFFWSLVCTTLSVVKKLPRKRMRKVSASTNTWSIQRCGTQQCPGRGRKEKLGSIPLLRKNLPLTSAPDP